MGKLSMGVINRLHPIAEAIDKELAKPQEERQNIFIECPVPATMKNNLTLYKSMLRRDWNSRFWMRKRPTGVEISFAPSQTLPFTVHVGKENPPDVLQYNIVQPNGIFPGDGPALELNDTQLIQHLLMENPNSVQVLLSSVSTETQKFLQDPLNEPTTALINFLQRRGYKYSIILNNRLRIFT